LASCYETISAETIAGAEQPPEAPLEEVGPDEAIEDDVPNDQV
jgi:hypothetical protein